HHARLVAHERNGKQRLDSGRATGDDRDRTGRRDSRNVAVAQQLLGPETLAILVSRARFIRTEDRACPFGERPALIGETLALALGFGVDELLQRAAELHTCR